jgi:hypothetical protein
MILHKLLLLIVIIFPISGCSLLNAQQGVNKEIKYLNHEIVKKSKIKSVNEYHDGNRLYAYDFDTSGHLTGEYIYNGGDKNFYNKLFYDDSGKLTETREYYFDSNIIQHFYKRFYDEKGRLVEDNNYNSVFEKTFSIVYEYDDENRTLKILMGSPSDKFRMREDYFVVFDSLNRRIESIDINKKSYYIYCDSNNKENNYQIHLTTADTAKTKFGYVEYNIYNYRNKLVELFTFRNSKLSENIQKDTADGRKSNSIYSFPYLAYDNRDIYKYDDNGNNIEKLLIFNGDEVYEKTIYEFDSDNNCISEKLIDSKDNIKKDLVRKYDDRGNMIEQSGIGMWAVKKIIYKYEYYE